jgi:hypothetical protein
LVQLKVCSTSCPVKSIRILLVQLKDTFSSVTVYEWEFVGQVYRKIEGFLINN